MNHEETIFEQALSIGSPPDREEFLRGACADNEAMFVRLEGLLRSHDRAGKFLEHERPAVATPTISLPLTEKPGDHIGRYKLLQKIGEGGCGVVYMAEQAEPVRRRVALKIIKLGMDTRQVIARFEAERQALALMDHPNIAKVFDAGATDSPHPQPLSHSMGEGGRRPGEGLPAGRPYFVMELVRGVKITEYCDEKKLTTHQRLELFTQVCRAIQHAHQKGIIHRDLKPSNILVSLNDGVAVPKVIDFGIAKATTGEPLTDKTVFTAFEQFIGTPAYMSPEQALVTSLDIDTRTDIYALGVLLYELLTGHTPFDVKELMLAGLEAMRRTICEREPARPSTRVTGLVAADVRRLTTLSETDRASSRRLLQERERLVSQLRGDLDWIVMKCLEKDRARRYETANGLATDIQRYLNNEPVVARPPSNLYRFQKMVRRHRLVFVATGAVAVALLIGLGFSTMMFVREKDATRRAEAGEKKAETEAANSAREANRARRAEADAYLKEAQARRWSGRPGRRLDSLEALRKSAEIRPGLELRNEAIACMALLDLRTIKEWDPFSNRAVLCRFDANCERYARGETNGTVTVRRVENDQELFRLPAFGTPFYGMDFSPDGRHLGESGGKEGDEVVNHLRVWNLETSQAVLIITNDSVRAFSFSPDSRLFAVASFTKPTYPLHIYDVDSWRIRQSLEVRSLALAVRFHPTQTNLLAYCDTDSSLRIWDWTSGTVVRTLEHPGGVMDVCWHPDGHWLATACTDGRVYLWEFTTGQKIASLEGHAGAVVQLSLNRDGSVLQSRSWDGSLRLWDTASRKELLSRQVPGFVYGFSQTSDQIGYVAGPSRLGIFEVVRPAGYRVLRPKEDEDPNGRSCAFSRDGRILVSGHVEHVRFWDVATGRQIAVHPDTFINAAFHLDGRHFFAKTSMGVQEWKLDRLTGENAVTLTPTRRLQIHPTLILLNRESTLLGGASFRSGCFELLDLRTGEPKPLFKLPFNPAFAALSPDGRLAAIWPKGGGGPVEIYNLGSTQLVARLPASTTVMTAFSPNDRWVATGDSTEVRLLERGTWKPIWTAPRQFTDYWMAMAFSEDSSMLAVAHSRDVVRVFEAATGRELATLEAPEPQDINWLAFNPDGTQLAVASDHGPIHLWDLGVLRRQLAEMKLDWDLPPLPARDRSPQPRPITLTFLDATNGVPQARGGAGTEP